MNRYARHILTALITFAIILVANFALPRLMPGDPVYLLTGLDTEILSEELYQRYYTALGLDLPPIEQFGNYLKSIFDGTLGYSFHYDMQVADIIAERLPVTLQTAVPAAVISTLSALFLGMLSARHYRRPLDGAISTSAAVINAVPAFLIAMILLAVFSYELDWFPLGNLGSEGADMSSAQGFFDRVWHLIMPVTALVIASAPSKIVMLRNNAVSGMRENYILYARAKGLSPNRISYRHLFPNIGQPFIAMTGMHLGGIIGGSIVVETVFSINGMGLLVSQAIERLDYPVLQACLTVTAGIVLAVTVLTDLILFLSDPKQRRRS